MVLDTLNREIDNTAQKVEEERKRLEQAKLDSPSPTQTDQKEDDWRILKPSFWKGRRPHPRAQQAARKTAKFAKHTGQVGLIVGGMALAKENTASQDIHLSKPAVTRAEHQTESKGISITIDRHVEPSSQIRPPVESPKQEKQEKKAIDIYEIRAQLINQLLPGITDSEFLKLYNQIDSDMKGRELKNIDGIIEEYGDFIKMECKEFNIPEWIIFGMLATESRFDASADAPDSDAVGIAQITPIAGEDMGIVNRATGLDLRDYPPAAIRGLCKYVAKYRTYFAGSNAYAIQNYKTGPGHLTEYALKVSGKADEKEAARSTNVYTVINNVDKLYDPADPDYIPRVLGHGAELIAFLQSKS